MRPPSTEITKIGIAGTGAIGAVVARTLMEGLNGYALSAVSDLSATGEFPVPYASLSELPGHCDLVIECLPPAAAAELARTAFMANKDLVLISSCALLLFPELLDIHKRSTSRIFVPSGALAGIDGVIAMKEMGIEECRIASTKNPKGFSTAPYLARTGLDVDKIDTKMKIFEGSALDAAREFPANINVAATLSIASGVSPEKLRVEIWADPAAESNTHEIFVRTAYSTLNARIENLPDPRNPKSSVLAARSIVALLKNRNNAITLL